MSVLIARSRRPGSRRQSTVAVRTACGTHSGSPPWRPRAVTHVRGRGGRDSARPAESKSSEARVRYREATEVEYRYTHPGRGVIELETRPILPTEATTVVLIGVKLIRTVLSLPTCSRSTEVTLVGSSGEDADGVF